MDAVLKDVWEYTEKSEGHKFIETNDYFVFHHIAHMAYHLLAGGCGIRPFVDLWILKRHDFFNEATVEEFCKKTKIYDFYKAINALIKVWFEGAEHVEITEKLEKYILTGGAYGYFPNNAAAYTVRNGGKLKYLFSIAFPPGRNMKAIYPAVGRHPVLLPAYYIYRLFEKTLGKNNQSAKKKYNIIKEQDSKFINEVASLIKELKLDK